MAEPRESERASAPDTEVGEGLPAGRVLHRHLVLQVEELERQVHAVRRGEDEGVHRARVACRRLRAVLATYRPLLDRDVTDPIREEVRWLGRSLSDARDATVVRERLQGMVDAEPPDVVTASARARLDTTYVEQRRAAWAVVDATLSSDRYLSLVDALDRLVTSPPFTDRAEQPAGEVLPPLVRKDWQRLKRRVAAVATAEDPDVAWHDVRKRGKRLRYSAEPLEQVWGTDAKLLANAAKDLTSHLGERQDTVMSRPVLLEIAAAADAAGETSVIWGVLVARDEERRAELDQEFAALWETVSRKQLRCWLG
jgi:CHAD domain-containing protein